MEAPLTLRISKEDKEFFGEAAKEHGMTRSDLLRTGAKLIGTMSPWFLQFLNDEAARRSGPGMTILPGYLLEVLAIEIMAKEAADIRVYGFLPEHRGYTLFEGDNMGDIAPVRGKDLYERLLAKKVHDKEQPKAAEEQPKAAEEKQKAAELERWVRFPCASAIKPCLVRGCSK